MLGVDLCLVRVRCAELNEEMVVKMATQSRVVSDMVEDIQKYP